MKFYGIAGKFLSRRAIAMCGMAALCAIPVCLAPIAQGANRTPAVVRHSPVTAQSAPVEKGPRAEKAKRQATAKSESKQAPAKPADIAPQPATVTLIKGELTIKANNSDLAQTLQHVSQISGMTIEGLPKGDRIFGVYGPGNPSDVLTALLSGSRYNFVIVGDQRDGAPRKLLLTAKTDAGPNPTPAPNMEPSSASQSSAETDQSQPSADMEPPPPFPEKQETGTRESRMKQMMQRLEAQHQRIMENATSN